MAQRSAQYEIIWLVRRLFQAFAQASNQALTEHGITASHRAVMEFLYPEHRMTMSDVARKHNVTRQHIQVVANELLKKGLLEQHPNPASKRAPHLSLSKAGRKLFGKIRTQEAGLIEQIYSEVSDRNTQVTRKTLQSLLEATKDLIDENERTLS